jgi:hypothetical protein
MASRHSGEFDSLPDLRSHTTDADEIGFKIQLGGMGGVKASVDDSYLKTSSFDGSCDG